MVKKIGISCRITNAHNYTELRDSISHDWITLLNLLDFIPILIPNQIKDVNLFLEEIGIDGIILSGGDNIGEFPERDHTEKKLIEYSMEKKLPLLGVCRGMQVINDFFGGKQEKNPLQTHLKTKHKISLTNLKFDFYNNNYTTVNSFHNNIITNESLAKSLTPFAISHSDGYIEGLMHNSLPIVGVMWHPERSKDNYNNLLLKKIFIE